MEDDEIKAKLEEAQRAVLADEAKVNRRKIVAIALEHGWTKYKIAAALDVKGPTVDSIIETIERRKAAAASTDIE
jgi:DNA-binding NarL/FixJ family response regulator